MKSYTLLSLILVLVFAVGAIAQDYVGSDACQVCHNDNYDEWVNSGHHYKLNQVTGGQAPVYPFEYYPGTPNVTDPPVANGSQVGWDEVSYVIGGYFWKARFMDLDGYIITGSETDTTQWNIWNQNWVAYHAGQTKSYDCGRCHTTGYDDQGHQGGLPGIVGTWNEEGIGCEACHGPGSDHVAAPSSSNISVDETSELCGQCHYRDSEHRIAASGGWVKHHEQYDEFLHSPHYGALTCGTCHEPHPSTVYDQGGLKTTPTCETCHQNYEIEGMETLECWDCHMPYAAKSANLQNDYAADVHSHQFKIWITTSPSDSMFYTDSTGTFVKLDESGEVYGNTLDRVCLRCHTEWTIDDVYDIADNIHEEGIPVEPIVSKAVVDQYALEQNYPNPFNPSTVIEYSIPRADNVNLSIYDINGRRVAQLFAGHVNPGRYHATFEGKNLASGVYIYKLATSEGVFSKKMLLFK